MLDPLSFSQYTLYCRCENRQVGWFSGWSVAELLTWPWGGEQNPPLW